MDPEIPHMSAQRRSKIVFEIRKIIPHWEYSSELGPVDKEWKTAYWWFIHPLILDRVFNGKGGKKGVLILRAFTQFSGQIPQGQGCDSRILFFILITYNGIPES